MIKPTAEQWIDTTNLKPGMETDRLEEALLSIEKRQSNGVITTIIWSLGSEIGGL